MSAGLATHGVGGSTDLPIPFLYAMVGASWALTVSFAVLALAWKEPRLDGPAPRAEPPRRRWLAVIGFALTAWVLLALYGGTGVGGLSAIYILVWVGLVPLALGFGHIWKDLSPWRSIQAIVGRILGRPDGFVTYRLGYWPGVVGLFAFVWLELASPDAGSADAMRWWVAVYIAAMVVGGVVFGPRWLDRADPFDLYSFVISHLSPFVEGRRWRLHNPLRTLPHVPRESGLVAVLAVLLGSTAYDSFSASPWWQRQATSDLTNAFALLGFCLVVALLFVAAAVSTGGVNSRERRLLPGWLAHSLVPIVVGYIVAHYLTYFLEKGQVAIYALADPFSRGWQPFGEPHLEPFLSTHTSTLAALKVTAVVIGHVVAVVAAHDKALVVLPKAHRLSGQLAMLVLMVTYTFTGLFLLFSV